MPFIDLSSPDEGAAAQTTPPQTSAPQPVGVVPQAVQQVATPQPLPQQPVVQAQPDVTNIAAVKENLAEEHELMRNIPELDVKPTSVDAGGVKEMMGPPLPSAGNPVAEVVQSVPQPKLPDPPVLQVERKDPLPVIPQQTIPQPAPITTTVSIPQPVAQQLQPMPSPLGSQLPVLPPLAQPIQPVQPSLQGVELLGTASGKQNEVEKIFKKADLLTATMDLPAGNMINPAARLEPVIKPITAGERFYADRASIDDFLDIAEEKNASDIHLSVGYPPMIRVDGALISLGGTELTLDRIKRLFSKILTKDLAAHLDKDLDVDFSYSHTSGTRFRVNIFHKKGVLAGAFRLISSRIKTVAELGLPDVCYDFTKMNNGLILVTGPTGSGKSTSIAAMIQEINLNEAKHIITIEDPIEYVFPRGKALVDQREIGADASGWKRALRAVLRQDPNVVLVGEMRDYETIASTITVAETGHLVFSTLHTNSASQSIDRMIDVFPDAQQAQVRAQLANVILAVIAQRLIPVNKGGRKAVVEIMIATPAVKNAIRESKTYQIDNMIQTNSELGMITLEKSLIDLIRRGEITVEEAQSYTSKPDELLSLMKHN